VRFDWVVVGAGLSGATLAERIATQLDQSVLVVERRTHVAGNAFDFVDDAGVRVHRYGAHIFHTVSNRVWSYVSQFTQWLPYTHRVLGMIDGATVPLPFNLTTLHALVPPPEAEQLERRLVEEVGLEGRVPVLSLLEHTDPRLRTLGELVYEKVFLHYTVKQWGQRPEDIDRAVTGRVPVVVSRDDRYFRDRHQGIPVDGYTTMVGRMLDHPRIAVETGVDFREVVDSVRHGKVVYTGPIDEFFDHAYGPLPYRSLRFEHHTLSVDRFQGAAVVNFPDAAPYTRIIEHAHFGNQHLGATTVTYEFPEAYEPGYNEPYYPLPMAESRQRYARYAAAAAELRGKVFFSGRLAEYRYYDMDQAVAHALTVFRNEIAGAKERHRVGATSVVGS
jgi:UDP-galactopyranose mutase